MNVKINATSEIISGTAWEIIRQLTDRGLITDFGMSIMPKNAERNIQTLINDGLISEHRTPKTVETLEDQLENMPYWEQEHKIHDMIVACGIWPKNMITKISFTSFSVSTNATKDELNQALAGSGLRVNPNVSTTWGRQIVQVGMK